jgi:hypothetical protein
MTVDYRPSSGFGSSNSLFSSPNSMMLGNMLAGPLQNLLSAFSKPSSSQQNKTQQQPPPPPPPAVVSISTQPVGSVRRGDPISVTWWSNYILVNPPCQVTQNGTVIATGPSGAQAVTTSSTTPASLTFSVMCKAANTGSTIQQDATVTLR